MNRLEKLKAQRDNYWKLIKMEEYFHYPSDPDQDMENYKTLCEMIDKLENEPREGK